MGVIDTAEARAGRSVGLKWSPLGRWRALDMRPWAVCISQALKMSICNTDCFYLLSGVLCVKQPC